MKTEYDEKRKQMSDEKRKQFYLFAWDSDNPSGGTSDLIGSYASIKDARKSFRIYRTYRESIDVGSILDRLTGSITLLGEVRIPNYEPDWEDIAGPKKLSEWGIEITGHWSTRHKRLYCHVSQKVWNNIKDITYQEFIDNCWSRGMMTPTGKLRFTGISRKRIGYITENIRITETNGEWK